MDILFFTHNYPPEVNAAASRVSERAQYWLEKGHTVTVVTCNPHFPQGELYQGYNNHWYYEELIDGVKVIRVKTLIAGNKGFVRRTLSFLVYMLMAVIFGVKQRRPDVVISTSPQFFAACGAWMVSFLKRVPYVFELGDIWPASLSAVGVMKKNMALNLLEKVELFLYRRSVVVIALTRAFKRNLVSRGIPAEKISVVINGVDLKRYEPKSKNEALSKELGLQDKFVIGYIGTHGMAHALENVLDAAQKTDNPNIVYLFVGDGAARPKLLEMKQRLGLSNVMFVPAQPKSSMPDYWSLCDVSLVHLKDSEAFKEVIPSKIFEAMGMGKPILFAGPEGEASGIIAHDGAGMIVAPEDSDLLAQAANTMALDHVLLESYAVNSAHAAKRHSREKQADDMIDAIERALMGEAAISYQEEV